MPRGRTVAELEELVAQKDAEIERLRGWLRLVEATTDHDSGYFALHGYDAPSEERIEGERRFPEHTHPGGLRSPSPFSPVEDRLAG